MALLPPRLRALVPNRIRDEPRIRSLAVGVGLIPPRSMHSAQEGELLAALASSAAVAVEIGVYEGSSAEVLCSALPAGAELHLIDPFGHHPMALPRGWGATEWASRRVVARAQRRGAGARVVWHVERSDQAASRWSRPVDLLFIDGDHAEAGVTSDWALWHDFVVPGGRVAFHDARQDKPRGRGLPGPTAVVDRLFRDEAGPRGWTIEHEVDRTVVVRRDTY